MERAEELGLELMEPVDFQAIRGKGVRALMDATVVLVGRRRLIAEAGIDP